MTGTEDCWQPTTWMSPVLQLACSLLEYHGPPDHPQLLGRPLPGSDGVLGRPHLPGRHHQVLGRLLLTVDLLGRQLPLAHPWCPARLASMTMTGPLADPSPADPSYAGPSSAGPSLAGPSPAGPSTASVGPVTLAGSSTSAADYSMCSGWAGKGITVMVLLSGDWAMAGDSCTSRLDVGWTRPLSTFTSLVLMMNRQTLAICWRPRWWWRQGPTITRWLAMMVMGMRGRPWRLDIRRPRKWHGSTPDHPWNQPASWSWTHPIDDVGRARSLSTSTVVSRRMMGRWGVLASVGPMRSSIGLPTSWSVAFRLIDTLKATDFLGSQDLEGLLADCSTSVAFDLEPVAVLALFVLDDPSLLRLVGSWRTSSGVCISTESSIVSRSWDFFAAFAALHLRFCSLAFSWACQASGSQSLQISQGESSVHKVRPSFRRDCWQR